MNNEPEPERGVASTKPGPAGPVRMIPVLTMEDLAGVGMIQDLAPRAGTKMEFPEAMACWQSMSPKQRENTRQVYAYYDRLRKARN